MRAAVACDHAGLVLKRELLALLGTRGIEVEDLGTDGPASVDYPDFAAAVARKVAAGQVDFGLLICGTGIGMSITANKFHGVRAAVCTSEFEARATRQHNDANVLCLGERVVGGGLAASITAAFIDTKFEGGRHERRLQKIADAEAENRR